MCDRTYCLINDQHFGNCNADLEIVTGGHKCPQVTLPKPHDSLPFVFVNTEPRVFDRWRPVRYASCDWSISTNREQDSADESR